MNMDYCMHCGARLEPRQHADEGLIPFCPRCGEFRFPVFSTAVSMVITTPDRDRILLIRQYGKPRYILCAGYVNKGEDAESAVVREIREELGLAVTDCRFNRSRYFTPSNTLMLNFTVVVPNTDPHPNHEIDDWRWFTPAEAKENIAPGSLAAEFLNGYLDSPDT